MSVEIRKDLVYGGFWIRVLASIVDTIITSVAGFVASSVFGFVVVYNMLRSGLSAQEAESVGGLIGFLLGTFITFMYFAAFESSVWQATPGKKAVGVKVTDEDGGRISFGRATGRYFAKILSSLILLVGFMMVGWTKRKQGLHDMIAGTLVVKE